MAAAAAAGYGERGRISLAGQLLAVCQEMFAHLHPKRLPSSVHEPSPSVVDGLIVCIVDTFNVGVDLVPLWLHPALCELCKALVLI